MKNLIFALFFGLVGVANADFVCDKAHSKWIGIPRIATYMAQSTANGGNYENKAKYYENILISYHNKEFKLNHKESICAYMMRFNVAFLGTNLTAQDIEHFERFLTNKGEFSSYSADKYHYVMALKFLKYHNLTKQIYNFYEANSMQFSHFVSNLESLMAERKYIRFMRFTYGENAGSLDFYGNNIDTLKPLAQDNNCANRASTKERLAFCKIIKPIVQWAESNVK